MAPERLLNPTLSGAEAETLEAGLHARIVGQDEAIREIVSVYQTFLAGLAIPGRPVGNFLFLGPTGTGKTRLVEALAESVVGDPRAILRVDCGEFQHSHEVAKLIGSPPGYLGHRETHPVLSQEALDKCHTERLKLSFVLFDEIEKASDALWNLLLGILDKATLTLGDNRQVDFSNTMIFMTSNLGARDMTAALHPGLGFAASAPTSSRIADHVERAGVEAARSRFTPEFLNRIDKVVVFHPLGSEELRRILDLELDTLRRRFRGSASRLRFEFSVTEPVKDLLLREGTDVRYGARPLKRVIERTLVAPMANLLATSQVECGDSIRIDLDPNRGQLLFYKQAERCEAPESTPAADALEAAPSPRVVAIGNKVARVAARRPVPGPPGR